MAKMLKQISKYFLQRRVQIKLGIFCIIAFISISNLIPTIWAVSPGPGAPTPGIFGKIVPPAGVAEYQEKVEADSGSIGLILFISNLIKLITVVAGVWTMFNFISAGWIYLNAVGDASANEKAGQLMTNSVIGLVIIAASYTLAGIVGYLIFDDAGFILNPDLTTISDLT